MPAPISLDLRRRIVQAVEGGSSIRAAARRFAVRPSARQRLIDPARFGFLRQTGIMAPLVLDGPMTGPAFCAYVEQFLAPALEPGDVVVRDNGPQGRGR